jgi:hypothetical protein
MTTDLLRWPVVGPVLRWRRFRTAAQIVMLLVAVAVIAHGLFGPQLAPRNLSTVLAWIHYRGLLIGALLAAGNALCGACPMILVRDIARRLHAPTRHWPQWLGRKWVALVLFAGVLFAYELYDLWALPAATAWLVIGYFGAAVLVDVTFTGAAFCKHVCPVGQFNFITSTLSPLELRVREQSTCSSCVTVDCIKGRRDQAAPAIVVQRGCELALFLPSKVGNLECTFCLDCVQACPHDNVAIGVRVPGDELVDDRPRSVIGRLSRRPDLAVLSLLFTFGGLLNAFAMIGPVYVLEEWLSQVLGTSSEAVVLGLIFAAGLALIPLLLTMGAAAVTSRAARSAISVGEIAVRYAYALVPLGAGIWLAHYSFHFLTAIWTVVPVAQSAAIDFTGRALLGDADWRWMGLRPGVVFPVQIGAVLLGMIGSFLLVHGISERDHSARVQPAAAPWHVVVTALAIAALWVIAQPMEMRGTGFGG